LAWSLTSVLQLQLRAKPFLHMPQLVPILLSMQQPAQRPVLVVAHQQFIPPSQL